MGVDTPLGKRDLFDYLEELRVEDDKGCRCGSETKLADWNPSLPLPRCCCHKDKYRHVTPNELRISIPNLIRPNPQKSLDG